VRSVILYGSETWYLGEKELSILRRTERAMISFEKDRESHDQNNVWDEVDGQEKH